MPPSKQESQRKLRAAESAAAKQKQLEPFAHDAAGPLTTNQGVPVPDNHNSLRAGERGPTLLEDFIFLEKLTHFDHERIPERVSHARGAAAHGYFELTRPLGEYTSAAFLQDVGTRTPVFVRFSTLAGSRGSADTVRDVRGFAVKFYTREGNYDLVGLNFPVFFIQDAIKYPDLVHAMKPEPHHEMPQASSAHDTFWDFASLMPETTHMLMWLMSDRGLPRSWRMMDGFGVHTFRLVNAAGVGHHARFQWRPRLGRHALAQDEALELAGRDPDFHRRDLWEAIEQGCCPEWELALQVVPDDKAAALGFDLLDATKLVPEELVPPLVVGKLVLHRNPENFFAESEQVAFHPGHLVPGIDFSNDPLLQGRLFSYSDSQLSRLGGPNGHELPINRGMGAVRNFQRDGPHRLAIARGSVAYEPNSLASGTEFRADGGERGYQSYPDAVGASKVRRRSASFDDHFSQASLFWASQSACEKDHIVAAFQYELARVQVKAIRQRLVDNLAHVDARLARRVAEPLGIEVPDARAAAGRAGFRERRARLPLERSAALSMELDGPAPLATRRVAVLVSPGVEVGALRAVQQALEQADATCCVISDRLGSIATSAGQQLQVQQVFAATSSVFFDAVFVPGGREHVDLLLANGRALRFVLEAYRHCKPLALVGDATRLLQGRGVDIEAQGVPGVVVGRNDPPSRAQLVQEFLAAMAAHRHWSRPGIDAVPA